MARDLKKFRHDIAVLKRRGLITGIDARSAVPTPKLRRALDKYDPVLSGKATAAKLSPQALKEYKALGKPFEIARPRGLPPRVIIPHEAGERVTVTRKGKVRVSNPAGISRTILPVKFTNLEAYLNNLGKQKVKLREDEQLAFRFFGNRSLKTFPSIKALVKYLQYYETVFDAIEDGDPDRQQEIYQNLEIVKVKQAGEWLKPVKSRGSRGKIHRSSKQQYRDLKDRLDSGPEYKRQEYLRLQRERSKAYRERLKGANKTKYKKAARKRAKKSKQARKGKK